MTTEENTTPSEQNIVVENGATHLKDGEFFRNKKLKSVVLPNSVSVIEQAAFAECTNLKTIKLSDNLILVKAGAFFGCKKLEMPILPNSLETLETQAFFDCQSIKSFCAPQNLSVVGDKVFAGCKNLTHISCEQNVRNVGNSAFSECENLKYAIFGDNLKTIGNNVFFDCFNLQFVCLGNNLKVIKPNTFKHCEKLESIVLPQNLEKIDFEAFSQCKSLKEIKIPKNVKTIGNYAFNMCESLENVVFEGPISEISNKAFFKCANLTQLTIPNSCEIIFNDSFPSHFNFLYLNKNGKDFTLSKIENKEFELSHYKVFVEQGNLGVFLNKNFRENFVKLNNLKNQNKLKFFPSQITLNLFPSDQIEHFFTNKNYLLWHKLCQTLNITSPKTFVDKNTFSGLFNLFYCLGGFSPNKTHSQKAFDFITKEILTDDKSLLKKKQECCNFKDFKPKGKFCPEFANFFMKHYTQNPNFMVFNFHGENGLPEHEFNYLALAQQSFPAILKYFAHKTLNGTGKNDVLTPEFVARHSKSVVYKNVKPENTELANLISNFGYSQTAFNQMQKLFKIAQKNSNCVLKLKPNPSLAISFRMLEKTDPISFVLGDITNCCQKIGDNAESCIEDVCTSPLSCFVVFENNSTSKKNSPFSDILGQAFVWYDQATKTVCFDNIEIPHYVSEKLENSLTICHHDFVQSVEECANSLFEEMNKNGTEVLRVTVGKQRNDLKKFLEAKFVLESEPKARNRRGVFSDAEQGQYVILDKTPKSTKKAEFDLTL